MVFAGDAVLVAHNARFDRSFLDRDLDRLTGKRLAAPVLDTLALARTLLAGRVARTGLASLSYFFGTHAQPCHRALPDAEATGEILLALIGLAQERGARTISDLYELGAPRSARSTTSARSRTERRSVPASTGSARGRKCSTSAAHATCGRGLSYFRSERQRPSVEVALSVVDRIEWDVLGSELEAGLEELRLIRELRPPANARQSRPDRYVYLRQRGDGIVVSRTPGEIGPIRSRRQAELAARALAGAAQAELDNLLGLGGPLPRLRAKLRDLSDSLRYEDAARLRDRIQALERLVRHLRRLQQLRSLELCILAPAVEPGMRRAFFLSDGRVQAVRTVPPGAGAALELDAGVAAAARARSSWTRNRWTSSCSSGRSCSDRRRSSSCAPSRGAPPGARPDPLLRFSHTGPRYGCPREKGNYSDSAPGCVRGCATCSGRRYAPDRDLHPELSHPGRGCDSERPLQASQAVRGHRGSADDLLEGPRTGTAP